MYLIAKEMGGHRAIPIKVGDSWNFYKLNVGRREVRIVLRLRGRRYLLYSSQDLANKYPELGSAQFTVLCDEIIAVVSDCITRHQEYIDFERIAQTAECRHHRRWRDKGLIAPTTPEHYHGHLIDAETEHLVSYVRVELPDIILMDHEPTIDCEQEELPY